MPTHQSYDVIVLGAGSAGFSAAEAAHKQGARVCIIEKEKLGGECPHVACVPSKAMLKVSKTLQTLRQAKDYGLTTGGIETDFAKMMAYPKKVVQQITGAGTTDPYEKRLRQLTIDRVMGEGHFFDGQTLVVTSGKTETWLKAKAFVVATGSIPFIPSIEGIDQVHTLTFKDIWSLKHQPKSLAIIGGGPVGCEFATFFSAIGTHVTLIHSGPYILNREDEEISRLAQEAMEEQGIEIITSTQVNRFFGVRGAGYGIELMREGKQRVVAADDILIAAGKRPNKEKMGLEALGITLDKQGYIQVNKEQHTNTKQIFAAGDVSGGYQFTHAAHAQGVVAGTNAAFVALKKRRPLLVVDERVIPRVTFIDPEVASVGMTQKEAKKKYGNILVGTFSIPQLGRSATESVTRGFIKLIADKKTRKILGGHIIGPCAGEIIHEIALAMYLHAKIDVLDQLIHAFPTFSEAVTAAAANVSEQ